MLLTAIFLLGSGAPATTWTDWNQDGIQDLAIRASDGRMMLLQGTARGGFANVTQEAASSGIASMLARQFLPMCPDGLQDQANAAVCVPASSAPSLGMLLPLGDPLLVTPTGNVGIGNASPGQKLSVQGRLEILSGSLRFADGTTLSTASPIGPQGPTGIPGPQGPVGPVGLAGPQGPITAMPSVNQKTGAITIAGAGLVIVTNSPSTGEIKFSIGPIQCTWGTKTYTPGAQCFTTVTQTGCSGGAWTATPKTCSSSGGWNTSPAVICQGQQPKPVCGQ